QCDVSLFPRPGELTTRCSCPDLANPCKHVAAVHSLLAETFDADPFLLPALRGRDRVALLAELRGARAGGSADDDEAAAGDERLLIDDLRAATLWDAPGDLGAIAVRPERSPDPVALLRRLGTPPGVLGAGDAEFLCEDVVARAADLAWRLAAGGGDVPAHAEPRGGRGTTPPSDVRWPDASSRPGGLRGRSSPGRPR
ncbi:MAG TPA: SWIM zinc finger family protein, partial [Euzebyales bacterium]|nr:SWIM zinc finger family protein [Euzebyales bacterium]